MSIEIIGRNLGKRFNYDVLFQNINLDFTTANTYGVKGPNGSGKSTLLKMLVGYTATTSGTLEWKNQGELLDTTEYRNYFSYSAPYIEMIEEFSIQDFIHLLLARWPDFYEAGRFEELISVFGLGEVVKLPMAKLSSGQKQKVNLLQVLACDKPIWILDEPTSFLDEESIAAYRKIVDAQTEKLIIIASNAEQDFPSSTQFLSLV